MLCQGRCSGTGRVMSLESCVIDVKPFIIVHHHGPESKQQTWPVTTWPNMGAPISRTSWQPKQTWPNKNGIPSFPVRLRQQVSRMVSRSASCSSIQVSMVSTAVEGLGKETKVQGLEELIEFDWIYRRTWRFFNQMSTSSSVVKFLFEDAAWFWMTFERQPIPQWNNKRFGLLWNKCECSC